MPFKGEVLSLGALLERSGAENVATGRGSAGVRHTVAGNARRVAELIRAGEEVDAGWRFGILQTLDDYRSTVRRGGVLLGATVFVDEPPRTGSAELDAAFAALADHLAERDGWSAPAWTHDETRAVAQWYAGVPSIFRAEADAESPRAFRQRGILITERSLARA